MLYIHCHPLFPIALQIWTPLWWGGLQVPRRAPGINGGLMAMGGLSIRRGCPGNAWGRCANLGPNLGFSEFDAPLQITETVIKANN